MMKGQSYVALEVEDGFLGEKKDQGDTNNTRALLWGCFLVAAASAMLVYSKPKGEAVLYVGDGSTNPNANDPFVKFQPASYDSSHQRYHNASFPGTNDTNTILECCSARIIVELERHFSKNIAQPFTTLQFDNSKETMCGSYITSVETYPGCCGLPSNSNRSADNPFGGATIPFWVQHCIPSSHYISTGEDPYVNANMTGFMVYYDSCPAYLLWDTRSCSDWINQTKEFPREIVQNVSLVNGEFTGVVVTSPNTWVESTRENQETSIFIPDVFYSCWQVDCGWGGNVNTASCIQFAQENLRKVSLAHYVDTIKQVECE